MPWEREARAGGPPAKPKQRFARLPVPRWSAPVAGIVALGLAFSLPVALWGYRPGDPMHLIWARYFSAQLWSGDLYPRWLMDMNSGLGSPTFFYYGCVPYYISSVFEALVPYRDYGWPALGLSTSLALVASGLAAYFWLREGVPRSPAFVGAALYMLLPYHLKVDYLQRFAFAEFWAFVWLPLILLYTHRCIGGERRAIVPLAVSYALLAMTHAPSTLLFSPVPVVYAGFMSEPHKRWRGLARVVVGLFLGGLLASIYLIPALTMQGAASIGEMMQEFGFYANSFLFTHARPVLPRMSENFANYFMGVRAAIGVVTAFTGALVVGGLLAVLLLSRTSGNSVRDRAIAETYRRYRGVAQFWGALTVIAFLMMMPLSRPVWDALPLLQNVQFPWRINIVLVCAAAATISVASAALMEYLRRRRAGSEDTAWSTLALSVLVLAAPTALFAGQIFDTVQLIDWSRSAERTIPDSILYRDYREYRPRDVSSAVFTPENVRRLGETLPRAELREGTGSVRVVSWRPRHIVLAVSATSDARIRIKQFYFAGWSARSSDGAEVFPVSASEPESLVTIRVPPGQHTVDLSLDASVPERAGAALSALALLALVAVAWSYRGDRPGAAAMRRRSPASASM